MHIEMSTKKYASITLKICGQSFSSANFAQLTNTVNQYNALVQKDLLQDKTMTFKKKKKKSLP